MNDSTIAKANNHNVRVFTFKIYWGITGNTNILLKHTEKGNDVFNTYFTKFYILDSNNGYSLLILLNLSFTYPDNSGMV